MLNSSNIKIVNALKNVDQKLQIIMKSDSKLRFMAQPIPDIPSAFINLLPAKSIDEVDVLESLLSENNHNGLNNQEELVSIIYIVTTSFVIIIFRKIV